MQEFWIMALAALATLLTEVIYDLTMMRQQRRTC